MLSYGERTSRTSSRALAEPETVGAFFTDAPRVIRLHTSHSGSYFSAAGAIKINGMSRTRGRFVNRSRADNRSGCPGLWARASGRVDGCQATVSKFVQLPDPGDDHTRSRRSRRRTWAKRGQSDRPKGASGRPSPGTILPQVLTRAGQSACHRCSPAQVNQGIRHRPAAASHPRPSGRLCRPLSTGPADGYAGP